MNRSIAITCGQLVVVGFAGTSLPSRLARALAEGTRGGAVVFRRNVPDDVLGVAELTRALRDASPADAPPLITVDQEGGRVARLGPPAMALPPMRHLGASTAVDDALARRVAKAQDEELSALGFTMSFAPVLDVDSNPDNPVIGDRAFAASPARVSELGLAWAAGLEDGGVLACGKHFPGHGDTSLDSHVDLPVVPHARPRLDAVELAPFHAAARAGMSALMTAHVLARALDPVMPATLSHDVCTRVLRHELGFGGVLVSDDLEMGALRGIAPPDELGVRAVEAGCDVLLVCADETMADAVHAGLVRRAERDGAFRGRCEEACGRALAMRARRPPRPRAPEEIARIVGGPASRAASAALDAALASARPRAIGGDPTRDGTGAGS